MHDVTLFLLGTAAGVPLGYYLRYRWRRTHRRHYV